MRRKLVYISALFAAMLMILSCSAYASNVLLISEEETVSGTEVATIMGQIAPNEYNITEVSIAKGSSLEQTINGADMSGKEFDSVIIQLPFKDATSSDSKANMVSAINTLYTKVKSTTGTKVFIGTPVGKVSNYDAEIALSQGAANSIKTGLTTIEVSSIPVYENIGAATSKSLAVCADNKLTSLGNLLVACTYCNSLGKPITTLSSYDKLNDADVKSIVEISSSGATTNAGTSEQEPVAEEKTENENTNNQENQNTNETSKASNTTSSSEEEKGTIVDKKGSHSGFEYNAFKADREPRLKYIAKSDYLYIEIRDTAGVACEFPSGEGKNKREANKSLQPQIYYYKNDKRGEVVPNLKRPTEGEYNQVGKNYVYTIGLPISEIGEELSKFELVAHDVQSHSKLKTETYVDEVFTAQKTSDGKIVYNRSPVVHIVGLASNYKQMAVHAMDPDGVVNVELKSLPRVVGHEVDTIRSWNGKAQGDWSSVAYSTKNKKYVADGLTKFEKIDTVFSRTNWVGLNPKVAGEDGVYEVMLSATDANGAAMSKVMVIDVTRWVRGDEWGETGNATKKSSSATNNSSAKSGASTSKKSQAKSSSKKNTKSKKSGSSGSGSSRSGSSGSSSGSNAILESGSKGEEVLKLQKRLNELGWKLEEDGSFGPNTKKAVKDFQSRNGLNVDGRVGDKTKKILYSDDAKGPVNTYEGNDQKSSGSSKSGDDDVIYYDPDSKKNNEDSKTDNNNKDVINYDPATKKENAIENRKVFKMNIVNGMRDRDHWGLIGGLIVYGDNIPHFEIDSNLGFDDFKISGNGIGQYKKAEINDKGRIVVYPGLKSNGAARLNDHGAEVIDHYITIVGYGKEDGRWYKDSCRVHYILAPDWWNAAKYYYKMSTNVGGPY